MSLLDYAALAAFFQRSLYYICIIIIYTNKLIMTHKGFYQRHS